MHNMDEYELNIKKVASITLTTKDAFLRIINYRGE